MLFAALFSMRTGFTACAQEVIDISDEQSLVNLAKEVAAGDNKLGAVYRVMSDIVVTDETFVPVGTERTNFEGVVEGNGHTVTYNVESTESGLFGYLGSNGTVRNLIVKGSAKGKIVGGVAGKVHPVIAASRHGFIHEILFFVGQKNLYFPVAVIFPVAFEISAPYENYQKVFAAVAAKNAQIFGNVAVISAVVDFYGDRKILHIRVLIIYICYINIHGILVHGSLL